MYLHSRGKVGRTKRVFNPLRALRSLSKDGRLQSLARCYRCAFKFVKFRNKSFFRVIAGIGDKDLDNLRRTQTVDVRLAVVAKRLFRRLDGDVDPPRFHVGSH